MTRRDDTDIGGPARAFPTTMWSAILEAGDRDHPNYRVRLEELLGLYWKPVFAYIRVAWRKHPEEAKDLTQAFFTRMLEKDYFANLQRDRGSFRGYLKRALKHFLINAAEAEAVRRRRRPVIHLDASPGEYDRLGLADPGMTPDEAYDREWFRVLFQESIVALRAGLEAEGKGVYFRVFEIYCLGEKGDVSSLMGEMAGSKPTYGDVAARLRISESDVRNYLSFTRKTLRRLVRDRIRDYVTSEEEVEAELRRSAGG